MDVGVVKVAEDKDFENLKYLIDNHDGWKIEYNKPITKVWTKTLNSTNFKMVKVNCQCTYLVLYTCWLLIVFFIANL